MNSFELKNKISSNIIIIAGIMYVILISIFALFVFPQAYELYIDFPNSPEAKLPLQMLIIVFIGSLIILLLFIKSYTSKKIRVEDSLIYFMKKSNGGFGNWEIVKIIDFTKVKVVKSREKGVFNGKVTVIYYWLIFEMNNGRSEEILVNGWDTDEIKKLFYYIRGKFSRIKFNNFLLKDSSEKLFGLDELMNMKG